MAIARSGPLVNGVAGSVGGNAFRVQNGVQVISQRRGRVNRPSDRQTAHKALFAQLSKAWSTLTADERQSWSEIAGEIIRRRRLGMRGRPDGFRAFMSWALANNGNDAWAVDFIPDLFGAPPAYKTGVESLTDGLWLTGVVESVDPLSFLQAIVYETQPLTAKRGRRAAARVVDRQADMSFCADVTWGQQLTQAAGVMQLSGPLLSFDKWTWGVWFRHDSDDTGLFSVVADQTIGWGVIYNFATDLYSAFTNSDGAAGGSLDVGVWHLMVVEASRLSDTFEVYLDGVSIIGPIALGATVGTHDTEWGDIGGAGAVRGDMSFGQQWFIDSDLTGVSLAALFNDGQGAADMVGEGIGKWWGMAEPAPASIADEPDGAIDIDITDTAAVGSGFNIPIFTEADWIEMEGQREWRLTQATQNHPSPQVQLARGFWDP